MPDPWEEVPLFEHEPTQPAKRRRRVSRARSDLDQVREFGAWTLDKLEVLRIYLVNYPRVAGGGTFLDLFAGEGTVRVADELRPGSALVALDSGAFRQLHLFELDQVCLSRLRGAVGRHRHGDRATIHPGDSNREVVSLLSSGAVPVDRPCFAFIDPTSTEIAWSTIETLAAYKPFVPGTKQCKIELWVLFNLEQAIRRLWPADRARHQLPPAATTLDRIMGDRDVWLPDWQDGRSPMSLLWRYCARLEDLGYQYVIPQEVNDPQTGRRQYWMVHASDHDAAHGFMRYAKRNSLASVRNTQLPGFGDL